jgi:hypothetical protein
MPIENEEGSTLTQIGPIRIPLTQENDPGRVTRRHLGREFAKGKQISQIIREAPFLPVQCVPVIAGDQRAGGGPDV